MVYDDMIQKKNGALCWRNLANDGIHGPLYRTFATGWRSLSWRWNSGRCPHAFPAVKPSSRKTLLKSTGDPPLTPGGVVQEWVVSARLMSMESYRFDTVQRRMVYFEEARIW